MADPMLSPQLTSYLDALVPAREPELSSMEAYAKEHGFPIIGSVAGQILYQVSRMIGARRIFELGSGYGYSTAWFARAVQENGGGEVHHVVWDERLSQKARGHLAALGFGDTVQYHVGEAVETLRGVEGPFDLIFNDIDKQGYPASLPVIAEKLRPGGVLIIDNMLWSGKVFDGDDRSPDTAAIREVTRLLTESDGWISSLIPVRDGLIVAMKK
ncbi:MAG: O-methyltransferase [Caldilineaceae bacterium]|nr:O-methyltransferase [Caldilineaceae bacterium]